MIWNKRSQPTRWRGLVLPAMFFLLWSGQSGAVTLTFDEAISGETSFEFDADADTLPDAVFTTTDPGGFNTAGPGPNQLYIDEPGLEGTTSLAEDLRVDFPNGAVGSLGFGFAVSTSDPGTTVTFEIFDAGDNLLATTTVAAAFTQPSPPTPSSFPEALVSLGFPGTASYATFDFDDADAERYIIDNFEGTFGSTEDVTPGGGSAAPIPTLSQWAILSLVLLLGLLGSVKLRRDA